MLINIQFLRFAAALIVVFYHASKHVRATGVDQGLLYAASEASGFAGVDIFFVISGFIMFYTTRAVAGPASSMEFMKRRLARIYSGYWPFFILAIGIFSWARPAHFQNSSLPSSFALWPQPLNRVLVDVSWTLSYELYFYLLFTLLVLTSVRSRHWLLAALLAATLALGAYRHWVINDYSPELFYTHSFAYQFLSSPFMMEFFAGGLLASMIKKGSSRSGWAFLLLGIGGFALAGWANLNVFQGNIEQGYYVVPRVFLFGIPSLLIVQGLVQLEHNGWVAPRRFSLETGGASYALYLSHTLFFVATMKLGLNAAISNFAAWQVQLLYLVYAALIVAFSVTHYRLVEKPLYRKLRQYLHAHQA
jgi:exopolysaccharide production protein ExoZ